MANIVQFTPKEKKEPVESRKKYVSLQRGTMHNIDFIKIAMESDKFDYSELMVFIGRIYDAIDELIGGKKK